MAFITLEELIELQPALQGLVDATKLVDDSSPNFCANDLWISQFKPYLVRMVGWLAEDDRPIIKTNAAYEVAYEAIYDLMPDCKDCGCMRRSEL